MHAVEDFGGTVKDLAGDGVLALFGAPAGRTRTTPSAPSRAALRIVEDIGVYARRGGAGVGRRRASRVRVGVDTGPVALGLSARARRVEYAAFGDTVNLAARLQAAAEPGTVLRRRRRRGGSIEPLFDWGEPARARAEGQGRAGRRPSP